MNEAVKNENERQPNLVDILAEASFTPNKHSVLPDTLELEKISTYYSATHFNLMTKQQDSLDNNFKSSVSFTLDSFRFGGYFSSLPTYPRASPCKNFDIEGLFCRDEPVAIEEHVQVEEKSGKARKSKNGRISKDQSRVNIKIDDDLNIRLNKNFSFQEEKDIAVLRKTKSTSEPTTEDSWSQTDSLVFPGLAGNIPAFRKGTCHSCKQLRLVFWFGDTSSRKRADRYNCCQCIKQSSTDEKFLSLFKIDPQWTKPALREIGETRQPQTLKEYISKLSELEKSDLQAVALNFILEEKKNVVQSAITKSVSSLSSMRTRIDLETLLFAVRFIHELIETLIRIGFIIGLSSMEKKFDCLDSVEKNFFIPEIKKVASNIAAAISESQRSLENDILALGNTNSKVTVQPHVINGFYLDYEERPVLGKRDPYSRTQVFFSDHDHEDTELDPLKPSLFISDHFLHQF